ncbi:MAG: tetratricopeptide repeat protein, partial [Melioribacteraceae bacterium]|nr:tetratricopeptide repeat protein [Melioribacteraceae bacterium]
KISEHQGTILQYYGDGTLSMFGSAIEAVQAAVEIQREFNSDPKIPVRLGIHTGDIVYEDEGVFGDGVNVASRIESISTPGGVLISEKVYDEICNHPEFQAISLGKFELKNVAKPIEIFAIKEDGFTIPSPKELRAKTGTLNKSIAVLPFVNMSSDQENEYFSDGITEEILNALAKVEGLRVTSRTSSFAFKGRNQDIRKIGEELNVSTVLEGSVRKAGIKVRITAQLINTLDGYHIWSETYDRKLEDIFEVQDEISRRIVNKLREKLTVNSINVPLVKSYTKNIDAYNNYLKAMFFWNKWTPESIKKSLEFHKKAIEMEPEFPLPYARLAGGYAYLGAAGYMNAKAAYSEARNVANKALELDENLSDAHVALAIVKMFFDWDWEGTEESFQRAFELNSNSAENYSVYSMFLISMRKYDEALQYALKAYELDPLSVKINSSVGDAYAHLGKYKSAIEWYEKTLELDSSFRAAIYALGWVYWMDNQAEAALKIFKEAQEKTGDPLKGITQLGYIYGKLGRMKEAKECLRKMNERQKKYPEASLEMDYAVIYAGIGDLDKVFEYIEKAYEARSGALLFITSRYWSDIMNDPRYFKMLEKMNLKI